MYEVKKKSTPKSVQKAQNRATRNDRHAVNAYLRGMRDYASEESQEYLQPLREKVKQDVY